MAILGCDRAGTAVYWIYKWEKELNEEAVNIIAIDKIIVRISQKSAHGAESFMAIN
jgi:hypothetical protein